MIIKVVPGIGDIYWIMRKMYNTNCNIQICKDSTQRGIQLFDLFEKKFDVSYSHFTTHDVLNGCDPDPRWDNVKDQGEVYLSANRWVDSGKFIGDWMPDKPLLKPTLKTGTSFVTSDTILIYTSSITNTKKSNLWGVIEWSKFIQLFPKDQKFHLTGAEYDRDLMEGICLSNIGRKIGLSIHQPLTDVLASIKECKFFLSRASGLGILGEAVGGKVYMMYPANENNLIYSWCEKSPNYFGSTRINPDELLFRLIDRGWIK
jgi:hypothetical protein